MEAYDGPRIVGMDLHRRRGVLVWMTPDGRKLATARIGSDPASLAAEVAKAGPAPKVVLEATYGWYRAADVLEEAGAEVRLAHPPGVKGFSCRRVRNDEKDAADLGDLPRMGRLPEAWLAPPEIREPRELTRCRIRLAHLRASCKDQLRAVLARLGVPVTCTGIFGAQGSAWLDELRLPQPYAGKPDSLRGVAAYLTTGITLLDAVIADLLEHHDAYHALQQLPGIGKVLAPGCGHPFGLPAVAGRGGMGRSACGQRDQSVARPRRPGAGARPAGDHALLVSGPAHAASAAVRAASDLACPSRIVQKTQVSSWRAAATLAMLRASLPRRAMMASLRWRTGFPAGWRWMASAMAQRGSREPCLVMCPRVTLIPDSRWRGVRPARLQSRPGWRKRVMSPIPATMTAASAATSPRHCAAGRRRNRSRSAARIPVAVSTAMTAASLPGLRVPPRCGLWSDRVVPAVLGRRGQGTQDSADLHRGGGLVRRRPPDPPGRLHPVGGGQRP